MLVIPVGRGDDVDEVLFVQKYLIDAICARMTHFFKEEKSNQAGSTKTHHVKDITFWPPLWLVQPDARSSNAT